MQVAYINAPEKQGYTNDIKIFFNIFFDYWKFLHLFAAFLATKCQSNKIMKRIKVDLEFIFRASPAILYTFITTPACLVRWYCDNVDIENDLFRFEWAGSVEVAEMLDDIEEERVRFGWEEGYRGEYLEFRMYKSDVTNETVLEITDFCDDDEEKEQRDYWATLIHKLKIETGG